MLLTYTALCDLVADGVITDVEDGAINGASIDVRLGGTLLVEDEPHPALHAAPIDLAAREVLPMRRIDLCDLGHYDLAPGELVLAQTLESFNLPDYLAVEFKLKSSAARSGLNHLLAGWGDPGWHGSVLTLELVNTSQYRALRLRPGMRIGQIVCWEGVPVPQERSYAARGQYNGDITAQASKGLR